MVFLVPTRIRGFHETIGMLEENDISPERLISAVDAVLLGMSQVSEDLRSRTPTQLLGSFDQPEPFCEFTRHEILAAEVFLTRCGILPFEASDSDHSQYSSDDSLS
jgi:hypothetical protein